MNKYVCVREREIENDNGREEEGVLELGEWVGGNSVHWW